MNIRLKPYFLKGQPSPTLQINELSKQLLAKGSTVYKFGFGQSPFPVPEAIVEELKKEACQKDYLPVNGLPGLRQAIASYNSRNHLNDDPDGIVVGPGSKCLIYLLQLVLEGALLLPKPSWVSYEPQARLVNKPVVWLDTFEEHDWMLHPETLETYCKQNPNSQKLLILNYPSNPTGATYNADQLQALSTVADQFGIIVISDEIYGELDHKGRHQSLYNFYPVRTIVSSGLSKWCGAGGWRLGTFTFPKEMKSTLNAMKIAASETYSSVCAPVQHAAVLAYQQGPLIRQYLENSRKIVSLIGNQISDKLKSLNIRHPAPQGGFYLMPNFEAYRSALANRGIDSSQKLCNTLLAETGVAMLPGSVFGFSPKKLITRLSYVDFDGAKALELSASCGNETELKDQIEEKIARHMLEGVDRMKDWLVEKN